MRTEPCKPRRARLLFAMCAVLAGGCSTEFGGLAYNDVAGLPAIDEFPPGDVSFRMSGSEQSVLGTVRDYLAKQHMPSTIVLRPPQTLVVTSYLEEPHRVDARRIRRTAFKLTLSQDSDKPPECTFVSISSLTQSRGVHEEAWTIQTEDKAFDSSILPDLQRFIETNGCRAS